MISEAKQGQDWLVLAWMMENHLGEILGAVDLKIKERKENINTYSGSVGFSWKSNQHVIDPGFKSSVF